MRDLQRVTVFCGSSSGADPVFADAARPLGAALGFLHHAVDRGSPKPDHLASISLTTTPGEAIDHRRSFRFTDGQKWS